MHCSRGIVHYRWSIVWYLAIGHCVTRPSFLATYDGTLTDLHCRTLSQSYCGSFLDTKNKQKVAMALSINEVKVRNWVDVPENDCRIKGFSEWGRKIEMII